VTLRNRTVMSPMTMYNSVDGQMDDYHVSYLGARAAGGFALIFPEQIAITPDGRTTTSCAGIWKDDQIEGHARVTAIIERMGRCPPSSSATPAARAASYRRTRASTTSTACGSSYRPTTRTAGRAMRPVTLPYGGGGHSYPVHQLTVEEIKEIHQAYADAAKRALDANSSGWRCTTPTATRARASSPPSRTTAPTVRRSLENRARFHLEALDAVREMWPEEYPLTMRLGSDDHDPAGTRFEDALVAIGWMKEHGLDARSASRSAPAGTWACPRTPTP
jgi:2,4-dienoyl-CoA reductase-like NADH-dependent reductase (Old Yellow Enzyme family)